MKKWKICYKDKTDKNFSLKYTKRERKEMNQEAFSLLQNTKKKLKNRCLDKKKQKLKKRLVCLSNVIGTYLG